MQHHYAQQTCLIEAGIANAINKNPSSIMSNYQKTLDDSRNHFLANLEDVSLIVGMPIESENLIENTNDELNRGSLNDLKKPF